MSTCNDCAATLVAGGNWTSSSERSRTYLCNPCNASRKKVDYLWTKWKIRQRDYDAILKSQGGGCAICSKKVEDLSAGYERFSVDHDHDKETLDIRGLLCSECNSGLGFFKDNITMLNNAMHYLKMDYHKIERAA
jgi:hypothetical protein